MARLPAETSTGLEPARSNGGKYAVLALLALALVGGAVWFLVPHGGPVTTVAPANPTPTPQPLPPVPAPQLPVVPPAPAPAIEVIVDSTPTGAKIVRAGAVVAETPEALKLTGPETIVLRKDGWVDKSVTVNPAATHKLVVKLERAHVAVKPSGHADVAKAGVRPTPAKPNETLDPYATPSTTPKTAAGGKPATPVSGGKSAAAKPAAPVPASKSHDDLSSRVEKAGESSGHRVGALYRGAAAEEGGRSDWFADLEGGHCYNFVGEGDDGVKKLFLYLWGPGGRRLASTREDTPHARMSFCTSFRGTYHFQAKVDDGQGEYRLGIYTR